MHSNFSGKKDGASSGVFTCYTPLLPLQSLPPRVVKSIETQKSIDTKMLYTDTILIFKSIENMMPSPQKL